MSAVFGERIRLSVFGESHGPAIGMTLTGLPPGEALDMDRLAAFLRRRAPGSASWATQRKEADMPQVLSGLLEGHTTGAPLCMIIPNEDMRSGDYAAPARLPRPGHADYTAQVKYRGFQDQRGGGHFSGRLTAPICMAGGIAIQILERRQILVGGHILSIAGEKDQPYDGAALTRDALLCAGERAFPVNDPEAEQAMTAEIARAAREKDSVGGVVECAVLGLPAGLGGPLFEGLEGRFAQALFAIPAVKGVEFGEGFGSARLRGSENNDPFVLAEEGGVRTQSNRCGGLLGGITDGMPVVMRAAFKPTPSIQKEQRTVDLTTGEAATIQVKGRHDPCILPRAVPCVEAAAALVALDVLIQEGGV